MAEGANPPSVGAPTYYFVKFSKKLHEIEKILDRRQTFGNEMSNIYKHSSKAYWLIEEGLKLDPIAHLNYSSTTTRLQLQLQVGNG